MPRRILRGPISPTNPSPRPYSFTWRPCWRRIKAKRSVIRARSWKRLQNGKGVSGMTASRRRKPLTLQEGLFYTRQRWQPWPASEIIKEVQGIVTDPSAPQPLKTSNIVIDATKQWPEEGGPQVYAERNRVLLERGAPNAMAQVDAEFGELLKAWGRARSG